MVFTAGMAVPRSPASLRDYWELGFSVSGGMGYKIRPNLEIRGIVRYNHLMLDALRIYDEARVPEWYEIAIRGGGAHIASAMVDVVSYYAGGGRSIVYPYFSGGAGVIHINVDDADLYFKESLLSKTEFVQETVPCLNFGVGFNVFITDYLTMAVEGKYIIGFSDVNDTRFLLLHCGVIVPLR